MLFGVEWYYWAILLAVSVLAVFMWRKALKTGKERRERLKAEAELWKRESGLRSDFKTISGSVLDSTPSSRLLPGVCMNIQIELEKAPDMKSDFEALSNEKKYVYALGIFYEDTANGLSAFFRNNGAPLTPLIPDALKAIGYNEIISEVNILLPMFDEDSLVSVDNDTVDETDGKFSNIFEPNRLLDLAAIYIKNNRSAFLPEERE